MRMSESIFSMIFSKQNLKRNVLILMVVLLPVIQAGGIALFYFVQKGTGMPLPMWNDEGAYYTLVKTWLTTGQPVGYWGFNGGHAILGTGSAWSPAIIFPYGVFGMMFGWNYSSVFFANILFLCLAHLFFMLLVKPSNTQLLRMLLLQGCSVMVLLYSTTLMSEMLRFSLAIILAGMIYRLYFMEHSKLFSCVVLPIYIIAVVQVYIFFVFVVPIYVFGLLKEWNKGGKMCWWFKAGIALGGTAIVGGGSYYLLHLISSNYNIYKTENLLKALQSLDFRAIARSVMFMLKEGLYGVWMCFQSMIGHGLFKWFVPFLLLLIILPLGKALWSWKKRGKNEKKEWKKEEKIFLQISFGLALFLGAFITVYSLEAFTFFRSMCIVVIFSMYLLSLGGEKILFRILFLFYALGMVFLPANSRDFNTERYQGKEVRQEWKELGSKMEEIMVLDHSAQSENNPWINTVALYTLEPKVLASMPAGIGVNMMMYSTEIPQEAEYLFFSMETEEFRSDWLEQDFKSVYEQNKKILESNYKIIYQTDEYCIYKNLKNAIN